MPHFFIGSASVSELHSPTTCNCFQTNKLSRILVLCVTPFIAQYGFLRVGRRLDKSSLDYDTKHILSKHSNLTRLVIRDAHLWRLHSDTCNTLAIVHQRFWILSGRPTVRKEILHFIICARLAERAQQLMGQLPTTRVTPSRPFYHSGIDYAEPFKNRRDAKTYNVVVSICSSTSALHLELIIDYSAFIAAYKHFTGHRGICSILSSDYGTTLIGADSEFKRLFTTSSAELDKPRILLVNNETH